MTDNTQRDENVAGDLVAGLVAGVAATVAITLFMPLAAKVVGFDPSKRDEEGKPQIGTPRAATRSVDIAAVETTGEKVPQGKKGLATSLLQFAFGTALGTGYGVLARKMPVLKAGQGSVFGTAVFAVADEFIVPALGLSGRPRNSGAKAHGLALANHLVYGLVAESVRRAVRRRIT